MGPRGATIAYKASWTSAKVPLDTLRHAVPAFPTRSEVWLRPVRLIRM